MTTPSASLSPTLGIHLRGTDKRLAPGGAVPARAYLPFVRAFLCAWPRAKLFVATDDERMLDGLKAMLRRQCALSARSFLGAAGTAAAPAS